MDLIDKKLESFLIDENKSRVYDAIEDLKKFCYDRSINIILDDEIGNCLLYCNKLNTVFLGDKASSITVISFINNYSD